VKELHAEFDALRQRFPPQSESSLVLPCLRRIQEERGFVADNDIDELVAYLGVPRMQIEEVLSYYTQLRRAPIGRWHLQACRNVACSMRGAEGVVAQIGERLGIAPGETSEDGRFTLSTVECLGSCGTAPVVVVNETYHENLTPEKLDALIERLRR
jgi:NADH-quinone oxidoreductase subunit E